MSLVKDEAKKIIDNLPEQANWDDIMYQFYVMKKVALAVKAVDEGKVLSHEEVKKLVLKKWRLFGQNLQ